MIHYFTNATGYDFNTVVLLKSYAKSDSYLYQDCQVITVEENE